MDLNNVMNESPLEVSIPPLQTMKQGIKSSNLGSPNLQTILEESGDFHFEYIILRDDSRPCTTTSPRTFWASN
jgi:hypothetical protein